MWMEEQVDSISMVEFITPFVELVEEIQMDLLPHQVRILKPTIVQIVI